MNKISMAIIMVAALACGGSKGGSGVSNTKPSSNTTLTIGELEFVEGASDVGLKLHSDGKFEMKMKKSDASGTTETWKHVGELTADGKVMRDGKVLGSLQADGSFQAANGKVMEWKLDGETLVSKDKRITLDAQGTLVGGNPNVKPIKVKGLTDAGSRRAALLIMGIMFSGEAKGETGPTTDPCGDPCGG